MVVVNQGRFLPLGISIFGHDKFRISFLTTFDSLFSIEVSYANNDGRLIAFEP